ncbi:TPA: hypothetical protein QIT83_000956 [Acinetobacter baumannii]|nr:hypothetical protein [Acinetobacter baumannii]
MESQLKTNAPNQKILIRSLKRSVLFMIIFYLAINNEPDYMPSQKKKQMMESHEQMNHAEMHSSSAQ